MTDTALVYDPSSYQLHENPFPYYRRMQDEAPLYHNPDMGFWALTRFDDVLAGLGDWATFSSAQGTVIEQIQSGSPPPDMMIFHDPPRHEQLRRISMILLPAWRDWATWRARFHSNRQGNRIGSRRCRTVR